MGQEIKIGIKSGFDPSGFADASRSLTKLSRDLFTSNKELSQTLHSRAEALAVDYSAAADKGVAHTLLSAKEIEAAWSRAMGKIPGEAGKGFGRLSEIAKGTFKGIGGALGQLGEMFLQGGIWGAASSAIVGLAKFAWDTFKKGAEEAARKAREAFEGSLKSIEKGVSSAAKSFDDMSAGIDKTISRFESMANKVKELTKAEIELAKQHAIANGMNAEAANAAASDLAAKVDSEAEEARLNKEIEFNRKRVEEARKAEEEIAAQVESAGKVKAEAEARYQAEREKYIKAHSKDVTYHAGTYGAVAVESYDNSAERRAKEGRAFDESEAGRKAREDVEKVEEQIKKAEKEREKIKEASDKAATAIEEANTAMSTLEAKREARELSVQNEIAAKVEEEQKKRDEEAKKSAEKEAAEKEAAAKKVAETQMRLDREAAAARERQAQKELDDRIKNHQKLIAEENKAASAAQGAKSAAESRLQRAWGWYRDKDSMAAQMAEEKADKEARKQYEKDFERLKSRRRDWRTAENLSVDDEAVRRVALAKEEKEAAEKHLAEIERNTADLAAKLDELLAVKG